MEKIKNIDEYYNEYLKDKDVEISEKKSYQLIKEKNKGKEDRIAISEDNKKITYGELCDKWDDHAKAYSSLDISRENNSRVLTIMPTIAEANYIDYGLDETGAVADFIDPTSTPEKILKYVNEEKITDIITLDLLFLQNIRKNASILKNELGIRNIILYHSSFINRQMGNGIKLMSDITYGLSKYAHDIVRIDDAIRNSRYTNIKYDTASSKEISLITHTSGSSSGMGKPIPMSDYNRNALVKEYELAALSYKPGMKMMHFIPYFAGYGAINTVHLGLSQGLELQQIPLFSPGQFGYFLDKYKPNIVLANTPCWLNVVRSPQFKNIDLSYLVYASSGGTATSIDEEIEINNFLLKHGAKISLTKGYGLSELGGCGITTIDGYNKVGKQGVKLPLVDIKLRDIETGKIITPNGRDEVGELLINSESITIGELDGKKIVEKVNIDGKEYLATKDIVLVDNVGFIEYIERKDRMFARYDAYNVYPQIVENVLKDYDEIENCVIVKLYDYERNGMVPKVYIKLKENIDDKGNFIKKIINDSFITNKKQSKYKANYRDIPRSWVFIDDIPKNTMGKEAYHLLETEEYDGEEYSVEVVEDNMKVSSFDVKQKKMVKRI